MVKIKMILKNIFKLSAFTALFMLSFSGSASAASGCTTNNLLGVIPQWHKYLTGTPNPDGTCNVSLNSGPSTMTGIPTKTVVLILAAVIEILVRIAVLVSVAYIIFGGFRIMLSEGNESNLAYQSAWATITNAGVGLAISVSAVAIINLVTGTFIQPGGVVITDLSRILKIVFAFSSVICLILIIIAALTYATSLGEPGDPKNFKGIYKAKSMIRASLIGLFMIMISFTLSKFVLGFIK